jgi:hypothetical protein
MYISKETHKQIQLRLLNVLFHAEIEIYEEEYAFEEFAEKNFPLKAKSEALAIVRDGEVWSQLVPSKDLGQERFKIFKFYFKEALDNSGFIGWLATRLKDKIGTGVFVICGQNNGRGGIYDYWGCPIDVAQSVIEEIQNLVVEYHRSIKNIGGRL